MFCPKCGADLPDGAAFCGSCGSKMAVQQQASPYAQQPAGLPAQQANPYMQPAKKRSKAPLIAAAAVVVIAAVVGIGFATGLFGGGGIFGGGPVYVITSSTYYDDAGIITNKNTAKLDDSGNVEKRISKNYDTRGEIVSTLTYAYDRDEYGNLTKAKSTREYYGDSTTATTKYDNDLDKDHRVVKAEYDTERGSATIEYEYHGNGAIKSRHTENPTPSGGKNVVDYEYDERGYPTSQRMQVFENGEKYYDSSTSYDWELDSKGNPVSCTIKSKTTSDGETKTDSKTRIYKCDEHGNIVKAVNEEGNTIAEYTYEKVDNPSVAARANRTVSF